MTRSPLAQGSARVLRRWRVSRWRTCRSCRVARRHRLGQLRARRPRLRRRAPSPASARLSGLHRARQDGGRGGTARQRPRAESAIEARTLAVLSLIGTVLAIPLLYRTLSCWSSARTEEESDASTSVPTPWQRLDAGAIAATALATACPLSWYLAVRPMSDCPASRRHSPRRPRCRSHGGGSGRAKAATGGCRQTSQLRRGG